MERFEVSVDGLNHSVCIKNTSESQAILEQRKLAGLIGSYIAGSPATIASLVSLFISYCGLVLLWFRFELEGIELFDYISFSDLFFGFFSVSFAPVSIAVIVFFLFYGLNNYLKIKWKTGKYGFWWILSMYLLGAPFIVGFIHLKILEQDLVEPCLNSEVVYEVIFSPPSDRVESELYLIASLSENKVFKKSKRGCKTSPSSEEELLDYQILVIPSNQIQSISHKANKQIV
ncbi:hypothetical protein KI743_01140 [Vibrio sp. D420a]|uniref:hypothetical protein n=1 Tax=Vibrio sp. D420a TaxID=2836895 RepID=UPI0025548E70|nr:hypothetical protein [Vibrio sp. D420a]MDK9760594.1 hypothetical protein [Vibrio sp. D420a]